MNTKKIFLWLFFSVNLIYSQEIATPKTPTVSAITKYIDHPVDLNTGIPNISIPLFTLPTRLGKKDFDFRLNYHPSSIVEYDSLAADFGRGWSLTNIGVVSRVKDIYTSSLSSLGASIRWKQQLNSLQNYDPSDQIKLGFQFSFFNLKGDFEIYQNSSGELASVVSENTGSIIHVKILYSPSDFIINGFIIHDDNGFKYVFDKIDNFVQIVSYTSNFNPVTIDTLRGLENYNFRLTKVFDNHNVELLSFEYSPKYEVKDYHEGIEKNTTHSLNKIISNGMGYVNFTKVPVPFANDEKYITSVIYNNIYDQLISKYDFEYNTKKKIVKIKHYNTSLTDYETYKLTYKENTMFSTNQEVRDFDGWGYPNVTNENCIATFNGGYNNGSVRSQISREIDPQHSIFGVLESITYPTGKCTVFDFESNTYSYYGGEKIEHLRYLENSLGSNVVSNDFEDLYFNHFDRTNQHNFTKNAFKNHNFSGTNGNEYQFTAYGTFYFTFHSDGYQFTTPQVTESGTQDQSTFISYPTFSLYKNNQLIRTFSTEHANQENIENCCNGPKLDLDGQYKIVISNGFYPAMGDFILYQITPKQVKNKWMYGPGIRIKKIRTFENENDFINNAVALNEVAYNYNFFNEPNRSSGSYFNERRKVILPVYDQTTYDVLSFDVKINSIYQGFKFFPISNAENTLYYKKHYKPIQYSNVTVTEKGSNQDKGKTEYTFVTPQNDPYYNNTVGSGVLSTNFSEDKYDYFSKVKSVKTYHQNGSLLKSSLYEYIPSHIHSSNLSKLEPVKIINKSYLSNDKVIETQKNYKYNASNRLISEEEILTNESNDKIIVKYNYFSGDLSTYPDRINEINKVETYRNNELLTINETEYYDWTLLTHSLPKTAKSAKGINPVENKISFNKYDFSNNLLEMQQENGIKISYIWGYNKTQPVAKLENIAYDAIPVNLITAIETATNTGTETQVIAALDALRNSTNANMLKAMITTYTYKPLVGVSTITDPKGDRITYHYDDFNRLQFVKDKNGNILSENEYHYRN